MYGVIIQNMQVVQYLLIRWWLVNKTRINDGGVLFSDLCPSTVHSPYNPQITILPGAKITEDISRAPDK